MTPGNTDAATNNSRVLLVVWIVLLGLTAGSYWISSSDSHVDRGSIAATAFGVLALAMLKGHLIAGLFMEMIHAPRIWAFAMSGFLLMLGGSLIALFS